VNCRVCGRQFDPKGFQVMVPGLKHGFDRVDCALEAGAHGLPPERPVEPEPAYVRELPPAPIGVPALAGGPALTMAADTRPPLLVGANLALLAAGTAATIYLWLRVFGPDVGPVSFPAASASPAFERSTVAATIDLTPPAPVVRPQPESSVDGAGSQPASPAAATAVAASNGGGGTLVSNRKPAKPRGGRQTGGPVVRPAPPAPPPAPPAEPGPTRSAPVPTFPVPTAPPSDRIPGPNLPGGGGGRNPEQPGLPGAGGGTRG
jgi:hypothetical protein